MAHYTNLLIARHNATGREVETIVDAYKDIVERNGGKVEKIEPWGVKSLAYRIKKNRKAHFTLLDIDAPPAALAEMERQMAVSEDVLRFMTVRVEELEAEPSAMMQRPHKNASGSLRSELDAYSSTILDELRKLNDDIEARI